MDKTVDVSDKGSASTKRTSIGNRSVATTGTSGEASPKIVDDSSAMVTSSETVSSSDGDGSAIGESVDRVKGNDSRVETERDEEAEEEGGGGVRGKGREEVVRGEEGEDEEEEEVETESKVEQESDGEIETARKSVKGAKGKGSSGKKARPFFGTLVEF